MKMRARTRLSLAGSAGGWAILCALGAVAQGALAQVSPIGVTGSLQAAALVENTATQASDAGSFDEPVAADEAQLFAGYSSFAQTFAVLPGSVTEIASGLAQASCSATSAGFSGLVATHSYENGEATGFDRHTMVHANATLLFEAHARVAYHISGFVGAPFDPLQPEPDHLRTAHVRVLSGATVLHDFTGMNLQTFEGGAIEATGELDAGVYAIDIVCASRCQSGVSHAGDPVLASASWNITFTPACNDIDFNNDGLLPDSQDIDDFLAVFSGATCPTQACDPIDFNNDALFPDSADLDAFLRVFSGGSCW